MAAAVVCTEPFVPTGNAIARLQGIPGYQYALVPHPIGRLPEDELLERVHVALPQVLKLLMGG